MLDTKANECACQCDNEVYSEVKIYLNFAGITSRVTKQFSHYFGFRNYFYFSYTIAVRHLG